MHQTLLTSAALSLSRLLTSRRIPHGFFGGFAILATTSTSPYRESKDLDVLVGAPKSVLVSLLTAARGWLEIPQTRDDYVAFFWKPSMVLVEMFVRPVAATWFPGATPVVVGSSYVPVLEERYLLRGKFCAAAARAKDADLVDILGLLRRCGETDVREVVAGVEKRVLGLALRRYPQLRKVLEEYGVNTRGAVWAARKRGARGEAGVTGCWDVQSGLGWAAAC